MSSSTVLTPADQPLLVISRSFDAPRELVWRCYTDPAHLVHFWAPKGAKVGVSQLDLRVGGTWRQVMVFPGGNEYGYTSTYLEITPPERLVWRDAPDDAKFGDALPPVTILTTMTLSEADGRTTVEVSVRFNLVAERDENVRRGFSGVVTDSNDKLADYLATLISTSEA